jgi:ABC-2 type transport system permease protein
MRKLLSYLSLVTAYVRLNLKSKLEYRTAFASQVGGMIVNDCIWIVFWCFFFNKFPVVKGWTASDVITLWAISAAGFGISDCLFCNAHRLAFIINKGQLDAWLVYPRRVLPHLILERFGASALGDVIFGFGAYCLLAHPSLLQMLFFSLLALSTAITFLAVRILSGSVAFFVGNAQPLSEQWEYALITFSTYPSALFEGITKLMLFTLIPAAFISYIPVDAIRGLSFNLLGLCWGGSLTILAIAVAVFHLGLRRYESGNLMEMRG